MSADLRALLQGAAARPRHEPDMTDVRRRAARIRRRRGAAAVAAAIGLVMVPAGVVVLWESSPSVVLTDEPAGPPAPQATAPGCEPDTDSLEAARQRYPELADSEETLSAMVCAEQDDQGAPELEPLREAARIEHPGPFAPAREARQRMSTATLDAWLLAYTEFADASRLHQLQELLPHPDPATDALLRDVVAEWSRGNFLAAYALLERVVGFSEHGCSLDLVPCDEAGNPIPPQEAS